MRPAVHFVGFRDERYYRARSVFGEPDFIHQRWDRRARREIADGDTIVFATGDETAEPCAFNGPDLIEESNP